MLHCFAFARDRLNKPSLMLPEVVVGFGLLRACFPEGPQEDEGKPQSGAVAAFSECAAWDNQVCRGEGCGKVEGEKMVLVLHHHVELQQ